MGRLLVNRKCVQGQGMRKALAFFFMPSRPPRFREGPFLGNSVDKHADSISVIGLKFNQLGKTPLRWLGPLR